MATSVLVLLITSHYTVNFTASCVQCSVNNEYGGFTGVPPHALLSQRLRSHVNDSIQPFTLKAGCLALVNVEACCWLGPKDLRVLSVWGWWDVCGGWECVWVLDDDVCMCLEWCDRLWHAAVSKRIMSQLSTKVKLFFYMHTCSHKEREGEGEKVSCHDVTFSLSRFHVLFPSVLFWPFCRCTKNSLRIYILAIMSLEKWYACT